MSGVHYDRSGRAITMEEWAQLIASTLYQRVAITYVHDVVVSTVWLGIDHRFAPIGGPPVIFETMVFGGAMDQDTRRYCTLEQATAGHHDMVQLVILDHRASSSSSAT